MRGRQVVFVVGVPRSGSTWLTDILSSAGDTDLVMEPDNEKTSVLAGRLKSGLPRFPELSQHETGPPELGQLWDAAFSSRCAPLLARSRLSSALCRMLTASQESAIAVKDTCMPATPTFGSRHRMLGYLCRAPLAPWRPKRIVKSVHAVLYPEWIVERCRPSHVIVIMRHPLAVLQSWRRMEMPDAFRLTGGSVASLPAETTFARMAEQLCRMYRSLLDATARNPAWQVVWHETLCADPAEQMRAVAQACDFSWTPAMAQRVALMNQTGEGYTPQRHAAGEIGKWKEEITDAEYAAVSAVLAKAGMSDLLRSA